MTDSSHHIDGLEIDRLLARGGSASVYEAFDRRHSRKVAVKVLDRRDLEEPKRRAFRRELEAMGRLDDHPYVLTVFDSGFTEDGSPYLVMPLVSTGTVATRIARGEEFAVPELLALAVKLASALETAHQRGILHCDIKPSNLFIGPFGDPLLGDLGISSISDSGVTETNRVSITLRYAAPEVIEGADHTMRSDLYSLGATLFAMAELSPPFDGRSKAALVSQILSAEEPPRIERQVPPGFADLIAEMMAADPDQRPPSAFHVVERLQGIERSLGGQVTPAAVADAQDLLGDAQTDVARQLQPPFAQPEQASRRPTAVLIAAALIAVALLAGGLALWARSDGTVTASSSDRAAPLNVPLNVEVTPSEPVDEVLGASASPPPDEVMSTTVLPLPSPTPQPAATPLPTPTPRPRATPEPTVAVVVVTPPSISGTATTVDGAAVGAMEIDLFTAEEGRPRGDFVEGIETDGQGNFAFTAPAGCYVLTFVAPAGSIVVGGSGHRNIDVCVDDTPGPVVTDVTIAEAPTSTALLSGTIRLQGSGTGVVDVHVDAFLAVGEGQRGDFVTSTDSLADGTWELSVPAGCYIVTISAPAETTLIGGDKFLNSPTLCVDNDAAAQFDAELG